jgi:hypothetical protein
MLAMAETVQVEQCDIDVAAAIIDDLTDRKGLRHEFDNIDPDIQDEIKETWAEIVAAHRLAERRRTLEEAAKMAEGTRAYDDLLQKGSGCMTSGQRIAAAIRKLLP